MPPRCVVGGCSNVKTENVGMFAYPTDRSLWPKWDKFIKTTRVDFVNGNSRTNVCSAHFEDGDFENLFKWRMKWSNRLLLKKIAVPSRKPAKDVCPLTGFSVDPPRPAKNPRGNRGLLTMKLDVANAREVISAFYTVHCAVNS
jgi:hypothetical protein